MNNEEDLNKLIQSSIDLSGINNIVSDKLEIPKVVFKTFSLEESSKIYEYDTITQAREYSAIIPTIVFPPNWGIQILPPFGGATIRFYISSGKGRVSVYLDCHNALGYFNEPYWEIYPDSVEENRRYDMNDVEGLLEGIQDSLNEQNK